jgi:hypothetical protein
MVVDARVQHHSIHDEKKNLSGQVVTILQKDGRSAFKKRSMDDIHLKLSYQRLVVGVASVISVCIDHLKILKRIRRPYVEPSEFADRDLL